MALDLEAYIRQAAQARGINPDIAVRVAKGEGGLKNPFRQGEGPAPKSQNPAFGPKENSVGPFQLYISGTGAGLGDRALAAGIDPRKDWQSGVNFALDEVKNKGWGQWYGARAQGITGMMGVGNNPYAGLPDGPKGQEAYAKPGLAPATDQTQTAGILGMTPQQLAQSILANTPPEMPDENAKSPLQKFGEALMKYPDAPAVRFSPLGDARQSGSDLLKQLQKLRG